MYQRIFSAIRRDSGVPMRNKEVGFRVLDEDDRLLTGWGKLELTDLIPGDSCWGKLVFTTRKPAEVKEAGVPHRVQVAVNWTFPSKTYDILLSERRSYGGQTKPTEVGGEIKLDRVVIEVEGDGIELSG